jgi:hypothetical protein
VISPLNFAYVLKPLRVTIHSPKVRLKVNEQLLSVAYSLLSLCPAGVLACPSDPAMKMSPRPILVIIFEDSEIGKIIVPRGFFVINGTPRVRQLWSLNSYLKLPQMSRALWPVL